MKTTQKPSALAAAMTAHGLTVTARFVPFSQSRNRKPAPVQTKDLSLNWAVTLFRAGREVLTTDWSAGIGHCRAYTGARIALDQDEDMREECETGRSRWLPNGRASRIAYGTTGHSTPPAPRDVLEGLLMDAAGTMDAPFGEWAGDYGYDADSRKAEAIYNACRSLAHQLRRGLGAAILADLTRALEEDNAS